MRLCHGSKHDWSGQVVTVLGFALRALFLSMILLLVSGCVADNRLRVLPQTDFEVATSAVNDVLIRLQARSLESLWRIAKSVEAEYRVRQDSNVDVQLSGVRFIVAKDFYDPVQMIELLSYREGHAEEFLLRIKVSEPIYDKNLFAEHNANNTKRELRSYLKEVSEETFENLISGLVGAGIKDVPPLGTPFPQSDHNILCAHATQYYVGALLDDELFSLTRSECDMDADDLKKFSIGLSDAVSAHLSEVSNEIFMIRHALRNDL